MRSFVKISPLQNGLVADVGNLCHSAIFNVTNIYFNGIRENKVLAKISEFIVN